MDSIKPFSNEVVRNEEFIKSAKDIESQQENEKPQDMKIYLLKSHLDSVRDGLFIHNMDIAATVSEDWSIKFWDLKLLDQQEKELAENTKFNFIDDKSEYAGSSYNFYSYYTLRSHTGIITKITSNYAQDRVEDNLVYTAGIEGIVRVWKIPTPDQVNQFGENSDLSSSLCMYIWQAHPNEIIWDIKHHPTDPLVLSVGADQMVILWKTPKQDEIQKILEQEDDNKRLEDKLFVNSYEPNDSQVNDTPVWCEWIRTSGQHFAIGYASGTINLYEINDKNCVAVLYQPDQQQNEASQVNCMASHPTLDLLYVAKENGNVEIFDVEAGKHIRCIQNVHQKSISSIKVHEFGTTFITASHDGQIKLHSVAENASKSENQGKMVQDWIIAEPCESKILETNHVMKFNESICSIALHPELPLMMSCGADGIVKIYNI